MGLFCIELAVLGCADNFLCVVQGRRPVETLSEGFSDQGAWCSMVSADPGVYLEKELLALGNGDAFHENASLRGAAFVELAVDYCEGFGSSGYSAGCVAVLREDFVEEVSQ